MNIFQKLLLKMLPADILKIKNIAYTKIAFDASIMDNKDLGIGMYDMTNKVRLCEGGRLPKQCSTLGETEALKFSLRYASENKIKNIALFTDSQNVSRVNLEKFTKDYDFDNVTITWIPRDLNREADKLSKDGQKLNNKVKPLTDIQTVIFPEPANETLKIANIKTKTAGKGLRIVAKNSKKKKKVQTLPNLKEIQDMFKNYSYIQKARFISNLAQTNSEKEFGRMLIQAVPQEYGFQPGNRMAPLMRMALTIMTYGEMPRYVNKRFNKFKMDNGHKMVNFNSTSFIKEFNIRKAQALKKVNYKVPAKPAKPVMRTSDMMEMVETIRKAA
jgi:hypothetical protein